MYFVKSEKLKFNFLSGDGLPGPGQYESRGLHKGVGYSIG